MSLILFFDTETTGLPLFKQPLTDPKQPRIMQLAAILHDQNTCENIDEYITYIQIGSHYIHPLAQAAHNISREKCNSEGVRPMEAFTKFYEMSLNAEAMCCHNFNFDFFLLKILAAQVEASGVMEKDMASIFMSEIEEIPFYCTMQASTNFCALPFKGKRRGFKFPKLTELHQKLFGTELEDAHDAGNDVRGTIRCYNALRAAGVM